MGRGSVQDVVGSIYGYAYICLLMIFALPRPKLLACLQQVRLNTTIR